MSSEPIRRFAWFRFSLRVAVAAVTALCIMLAIRMNQVDKQRRALEHYRALGGRIGLDGFRYAPSWLEPLVYIPVKGVWLNGSQTKSDDLRQLAAFNSLERLDLAGVPIRAEDAQTLARLTSLQSLSLSRSTIDDAAVRHVAGLKKMRTLSLARTRVSNEGFWYLLGLSDLYNLDIAWSRINDDGLGVLRSFKKLRLLELDESQITPTSIEHLQGLSFERITVRCRNTRGRQQRDLLAGLQVREIVGISDAEGFTLWRANQPWDRSRVGVCENIEKELDVPSRYSPQLLRLICQTELQWSRTTQPPNPFATLPFYIRRSTRHELLLGFMRQNGFTESELEAFIEADAADSIAQAMRRLIANSAPGAADYRVHSLASYLLARFGLEDESVGNLFKELLKYNDSSIREGLAVAIRNYVHERPELPQEDAQIATELLSPMAASMDWVTRDSAFSVLCSIGSRYPKLAPDILPDLVNGLAVGIHGASAVDQFAQANPELVKPLIESLLKKIDGSPAASATWCLIEALCAARHGSDEDAEAIADALIGYLFKRPISMPAQSPQNYSSVPAAGAMQMLCETKPHLARRMLLEVLEQYSALPAFEDRAQVAVAGIIIGLDQNKQKRRNDVFCQLFPWSRFVKVW